MDCEISSASTLVQIPFISDNWVDIMQISNQKIDEVHPDLKLDHPIKVDNKIFWICQELETEKSVQKSHPHIREFYEKELLDWIDENAPNEDHQDDS